MHNLPYLHFSKDKNSLIKSYYIALIPLLLFSFYKNGILLYQNKYISFIDIFIPLYFYIISFIVGIIVAYINKESRKEYALFSLILACSISINTNMIVYPIGLFAFLFIASFLRKKKEFNMLALTRILLILVLLLNSYSYLNVSEKIGDFNYNLFDLFLGYGIGGIASNSLLLMIVSFIILAFNKFYKKYIAISSSISFMAILLLLFLIFHNYKYLEIIVNGSVYFGFVFVASDIYVSPNNKRGMLIYGSIIGIISALLVLILPMYEVSYLTILIVSFSIPIINKITNKKYLQI